MSKQGANNYDGSELYHRGHFEYSNYAYRHPTRREDLQLCTMQLASQCLKNNYVNQEDQHMR